MLPVVALVGRPNVGKSTLFNRLTRSRDALVADQPGLTRDRQYGTARIGSRPFLVVDTGGLSGDDDGIDAAMADQVQAAIDESDLVIFLVDGRADLNTQDHRIAKALRRTGKPLMLVANKTEQVDFAQSGGEFFSLGMGDAQPIAAVHGHGIKSLVELILKDLPEADEDADGEDPDAVTFAIIGRPNVGKSTLVNRILGEERVVAFDQPGTTRDSIFIPFERDGHDYVVVDTAGVRRRARVNEVIEKFSVIKALQALEKSQVAVLVVDAQEGMTDQDVSLLGHIIEAGRGLMIAVNKWDGLSNHQRQRVQGEIDRRLPFVDYAKIHTISALHGSGVGKLFDSILAAYKSAGADLSTSDLNEALTEAVTRHPPPLARGRRIKLRYAHQGGKFPPLIVVHGNQTERLPMAYKKYLERFIRRYFRLAGTPLRMQFKTSDNPFAGRKQKLTQRQQSKRRRMMKHVKSR